MKPSNVISALLIMMQVAQPVLVYAGPKSGAPDMPPKASSPVPGFKRSFNPGETDVVIVDGLIRKHDRGVYELGSVAYAVFTAGQTYDSNPNQTVEIQAPFRPGSYEDQEESFSYNLTKEQFMERALKAEQLKIEGYKVEGTWGETMIDATLGVGAVYTGVAGAIAVPVLKKGVVSIINISPTDPTISDQVTRNMGAWAMDQIRRGTEEGKILEPLLKQLKIPDPRTDRSNEDAVVQAGLLITQMNTQENIQKLIADNAAMKKLFTAFQEQLKEQNKLLAGAKGGKTIPTPKDLTTEELFHELGSELNSLSSILDLAGANEDAAAIRKIAQAAKVGEMIAKAQELSGLAAASIYLYAAVLVFEMIQIANQPDSPFPQIFDMLVQLSKQIEDLRVELGARLNVMDARLGNMMLQSIALDQSILRNTVELSRSIANLRQTINNFQAMTFERINDGIAVQLREEDRNCFQENGDGDLLPIKKEADFIKCRDTYLDRGTAYALSESAVAINSVATANSPWTLFPSADKYNLVREIVDPGNQEYPQRLAHPAVWAHSAYQLARLANSNRRYLYDFDTGNGTANSVDLRIRPMVELGKDLQKFTSTLLFKGKGRNREFRKDRVVQVLESMKSAQADTFNAILTSESASGLLINPFKGTDQDFNRDFQYKFLQDAIPFCSGVTPKVTSIMDFMATFPGGGHGSDILWSSISTEGIAGAVRTNIYNQMIGAGGTIGPRDIAWNKSILNYIPREAALLEQLVHKQEPIYACISKLEIEGLNQIPNFSFAFTAHVGLKFMVVVGGDKYVPVQELQLDHWVNSTAGGCIYAGHENHARTREFFQKAFNEFLGAVQAHPENYPADLWKDVSSQDMYANRGIFKAEVWQEIARVRGQIGESIRDRVSQNQESYVKSLEALQAMLEIGVEDQSEQLYQWSVDTARTLALSTPETILQSVLLNEAPVQEYWDGIQNGYSAIGTGLDEVAANKSLRPPQYLKAPMGALNQIYWMRSIPRRH